MHALFVITVEAVPVGDTEGPSIAGAYINAYVNAPTEQEALSIVNQEVADAGWHYESIDRIVQVTRADLVTDLAGLEYFEQALADGVVLVIHTFPPEPSESDAIH